MGDKIAMLGGLLLGILALGSGCSGNADPSAPVAGVPTVSRVEPPSWWAGHSLNPVRLLITGRHLQSAKLMAPAGFELGRPTVSQNGDYVFVDLRIPPDATPGELSLKLTTAQGDTEIPFRVLPRLAAEDQPRGFSPDDVIYLAMTDRFANGDVSNDNPAGAPGLHDRKRGRHYHGGDFAGVVQRLDYLQDLGVTALWLTPWYDNANHLNQHEKYTADNKLSARGNPTTDYHGYGAVDFYGVEEHFGDLESLREMVRQAHHRGIKVVQDQVANHTGPTHSWATNPPTPTWYNGCPTNHLANAWETWTIAATNPPPDKLKSTLEGWFIDILPDLNQNDPEVATYLIQNSLWWVGMTGLDAVRQDTLPYVPRSYWARWTATLKREHPNLTILGEMWDADPQLVSFFQGGQARFDGVDSGIEALFDFPMYYAIRDVFAKGAPMSRLTAALAADTNYVNADALVPFLGLHDTTRFLHEPGATPESLRLAFTFLLTTRGTPLIYYGDEIGMTGGGDPHNRLDFPGGWAEDQHNAFLSAGRTPSQATTHAHVQKLLEARRQTQSLRQGAQRELLISHDTYAFARTSAAGFSVVAFNKAAQSNRLVIPLTGIEPGEIRSLTDRLNELGTVQISNGTLQFTLPPMTAAVLTPGRADLALVPANEAKK